MLRPNDTSPEAHERQLEALRRMPPERRLAAAAEMADSLRRLVEAGIVSRHPAYTRDEVRASVAEVLLGPDLATELRRRRAAAVQ